MSLGGRMEKEFIVIKHPLKIEGNVFIQGINFCDGIAVIQKNSKLHSNLRKIPLLRKYKELSLDWLGRFGFRSTEIRSIFGMEVYNAYLKMCKEKNEALKPVLTEKLIDVLENAVDGQEVLKDTPADTILNNTDKIPDLSIEQIIEAHKTLKLCTSLKADGKVCKKKVSTKSSTGHYCSVHLKAESK